MAGNFINVASLVPDQHHCNLRLRVLSVEIIAETLHPETGKILQSAEAIVGDDTACILLNLKNDQVNLLSRNARLQLTNAHVNMYRGFMRLEVNEDEDNDNSMFGKPSITAIMDDDDDDDLGPVMGVDGDKMALSSSNIGTGYRMSSGRSAMATMNSGLSSNSLSSNASSFSSVSRDQMEVEMRLGTGGSVPLMEYYRAIEFTYFSTVEPVGR
ncbi:hypothetical protein BGZ52_008073 [Haplosporangium bisporale]|nr:hypothetical protein BGZ52_008073 [Haplosporangium bisporale]KAI9240322.1 MAG: hypothetical protein BYD32DRAFT_458984 [Podila humilis]